MTGSQSGANAPIVALTCKICGAHGTSRPTNLVDVLEAVPQPRLFHADRSARLLIIYVQLERRQVCASALGDDAGSL